MISYFYLNSLSFLNPFQRVLLPSLQIMFHKITFAALGLATTFILQTQANNWRPIPEYQAAVIKVMSSFLSPANLEQANAINSTLLSDDVVIRGEYAPCTSNWQHLPLFPSSILTEMELLAVDITEDYVGREKGTEYIWGLFANAERGFKNGTTQLIPFPISSTLQSVVFQPPMVASSVIVNFSYPTVDYFIPVQIDQFIRFDNVKLTIKSWDITFRRFAEAFYLLLETTPIVGQIAKEIGYDLKPNSNVTDVLAQHSAQEICKVHDEYCLGPNQQYDR